MKAIFVDSAAREIREVEYSGLADMQAMVGGSIETAYAWHDTGDVMFVDEEGLFKPQKHFFRITVRSDQPLAGNAIVVGRGVEDDTPTGYHTEPPAITVEQLRGMVEFRSRDQIDAWAKGNASEPAVAITTIGADGKVTTEVIGRFGSLFADMPKPDDESGVA